MCVREWLESSPIEYIIIQSGGRAVAFVDDLIEVAVLGGYGRDWWLGCWGLHSSGDCYFFFFMILCGLVFDC